MQSLHFINKFSLSAKVQKVEMDKREKERKERTKVEFVVATKKSDSLGKFPLKYT